MGRSAAPRIALTTSRAGSTSDTGSLLRIFTKVRDFKSSLGPEAHNKLVVAALTDPTLDGRLCSREGILLE